uniref:uncharacterized protein LOC122609169 n=1 Tax=Erigeron canadensis TaxID=72917 RepID=UPI001CB8FCE3|nr:uncharacterized protein LOC122609169 [Erigeron canadensis]
MVCGGFHFEIPLISRDNSNWSAVLRSGNSPEKFFVLGGFVLLVVYLLALLIGGHILYWKKPKEQKTIMVIILMPSIYALASYLELHAINSHACDTFFMVLDSIKECYAGLVIGMFLRLLYTYLNINNEKLSQKHVKFILMRRSICNFFPVTLIQGRYFRLNLNNLKYINYWTWQFVVIRFLCSVLMILLQLFEIYPIWLNWAFFFITNLSLSLAFYTVFVFYKAYIIDLPKRTHDQFFFVKAIIFVCFYQGGLLRIFDSMGLIESNLFWNQELQNNLVILEMVILASIQNPAFTQYIYFNDAFILPIQQPVSKPINAVKAPVHSIKQPSPMPELAESLKKSLESCVTA